MAIPELSNRSDTNASRNYALALLIVINILSYVDRHMLPAFAAQITSDLDLSRQQFGLLTGFAFVGIYAICGPLMGILADRFNPSRVIAAGIALWSVMTWLTGMSKNFLHILLPRMAIGVGEAALHPAALGILSRLFSTTGQATVFGLFFTGSHLGLGLAYWLAGTIGEAAGWRMVFYGLGAFGVVLTLALLISSHLMPATFSPPRHQTGASTPSVRSVVDQLWTVVCGNAAFRQAVLGISTVHIIYASNQFVQLLLVSEKNMPEAEAASLYGSVYLLCAIPASVLGGMTADWFSRRFQSTRALFVAIVIIVTWPLVIMFRLSSPGEPDLIIGMIASILLLVFPYGAMIALVLDEAPVSIRSTATALTMFVVNVLAIGTVTYAIGAVADVLESLGMPDPLTSALLGGDLILLVALVFYFRLHRSIQSRYDA